MNLFGNLHLTLRVISVTCLGLLFAVSALAQRGGSAASGGRVTPDRVQTERTTRAVSLALPSEGEECDPTTVEDTCPGTYSFSYGFSANASPRQGGARTAKAGLAFAVYLTHRVFLEVDNDNIISIKAPSTDRVTGFGDTTLYVGADALLDKKGQPAVTLLYGIKAPTASDAKGIGSGEVDHTLIAAIGKTLGSSKRSYLEFDVGDYMAGRVNASGLDHFPFASLFLNQKLGSTGKFKGHFEVGGDFATSKSNADMYSLNYLETRLSKKDAKQYVGLKTGVRFGITPNVSRAGLYVGLKVAGLFR